MRDNTCAAPAPAGTLNPFLRRLGTGETAGERPATYAGVAAKCFFFIAMILAGVALAFVFHVSSPQTVENTGGEWTTPVETAALFVALGLFFVTPFVAIFLRRTVIPMGILFCASFGYFITFFSIVLPEALPVIRYALLITLALFAVVTAVFMTGKVRFTRKAGTIALLCLGTVAVASLLVALAGLVPQFRGAAAWAAANPILGAAGAVAGILIVLFFLVSDLGTIQYIVENRLPAQEEWAAAFGLIFSLVWIFLEILSFAGRAKNVK